VTAEDEDGECWVEEDAEKASDDVLDENLRQQKSVDILVFGGIHVPQDLGRRPQQVLHIRDLRPRSNIRSHSRVLETLANWDIVAAGVSRFRNLLRKFMVSLIVVVLARWGGSAIVAGGFLCVH